MHFFVDDEETSDETNDEEADENDYDNDLQSIRQELPSPSDIYTENERWRCYDLATNFTTWQHPVRAIGIGKSHFYPDTKMLLTFYVKNYSSDSKIT